MREPKEHSTAPQPRLRAADEHHISDGATVPGHERMQGPRLRWLPERPAQGGKEQVRLALPGGQPCEEPEGVRLPAREGAERLVAR